MLPVEIQQISAGISATKKSEVETVISQIFQGTDEWEAKIDAIQIQSIDDTFSISLAETARKNVKNARLNAEKIFDAKREAVKILKEEYDLEDKLWLKAKQIMQLKFSAIEDKAKYKADYEKRFYAELKEQTTQKRIALVSKYSEINRIEFEDMSDAVFDSFLAGLKSTYEAKIEAEKKAEEVRVAKEKADAEERERQRLENERLKAEAIKREQQIEAERKANEAKLAEEKAKAKAEADRINAENEAKLKAEREAKAKAEAELKAKLDAEIKAKVEAENKARKEKEEAEKLAKAPIKKQLNVWVDSFTIPDIQSTHAKKVLIEEKFNAFKKWAKQEIENI